MDVRKVVNPSLSLIVYSVEFVSEFKFESNNVINFFFDFKINIFPSNNQLLHKESMKVINVLNLYCGIGIKLINLLKSQKELKSCNKFKK